MPSRKNSSKIVVIIVVSLILLSFFFQIKITVKASETEFVFQPMHIVETASPTNQPSPNSYSPEQIKNAYGLPSSGGAGTTIAIIDAYDTTSIWNDLGNFSLEYNLPLPTSSNFKVEMLGNQLASGKNSGWALETCLDVEWAHAIAPNATILLVEAASDDTGDLLNAVQYAISQPSVVAVSMSWGTNETDLGQQELLLDSSFANGSGISFFASSGDDGSAVNWPACSPNVIGVGGTILNLNQLTELLFLRQLGAEAAAE